MRILLLGDFSGYHATLARGLRKLGHTVNVASDGSKWMHTDYDISLLRPAKGIVGGLMLFTRLISGNILKGYDVVSIISPSFVYLRPQRLRLLFDHLRRYNGSVFLSACGMDKATIEMLTAADCPLRYSEYYTEPGVPYIPNISAREHDELWMTDRPLAALCDYVYDKVDGITTALYEYDLAMRRVADNDKVRYVGIPVDLDSVMPLGRSLCENGKVNVFLGRHSDRCDVKGTDRLETVATEVARYNPQVKLDIVEDLPYHEYLQRMRSGDIVLDQLYSYTPATNALLAMAAGQAVVSGAEPEYYEFIGETENRPVFNAPVDDAMLYDLLSRLVRNRALIVDAGARGRDFVARHNSADVVAQRCIDFWQSRL